MTVSLSFNGIIYTKYSVSESRMLYSIHSDTVTRNFDICIHVRHILKMYTLFKKMGSFSGTSLAKSLTVFF